MFATIERVLFLKSVSFLRDLPFELLASVAEITRPVVLECGEILMRQGEAGSSLYLLVEGSLNVTVDGRDVASLFPPECVGELSVLDEEPRSATVTATAESLLLSIDRPDFLELSTRYPQIAESVLRIITRRLRQVLKDRTGY